MKKGILTAALENADLPAAVAALRQDVVFHSPILATVGDEVRGHAVVVKILATRSPVTGCPGTWRDFRTRTGDTSSPSTEPSTATLSKSPCSSPRTPRRRWRAFAYSRARGRSSSYSESAWNASCVLIRSPTPSGLCPHLHRESEA
jgi:hypothetical protein